MSLIKGFCLSIIWTFLTVPAFAAELGQSWSQIIDRLTDKGITHVGDLNLQEFKTKTQKTVTWKILTSDTRPSFAQNRRSAFFIIDKKTVYVSPELPDFTENSIPNLELHEALGARGFNDRHYELSTALELLSRMKSSADRTKLIDLYGKTLFNKNSMHQSKDSGGSGSSVGGGGDVLALTVKNLVLSEIIQSKEPVLLDFLRMYPKINFEPMYERHQQFVALKYQFRSSENLSSDTALPGVDVDPVHGHQELITLYIPATLWDQGGKSRKALIKEIKQRALELFPAHKNTKTAKYTPTLCEGKNKPTPFPVSRHSDVQIIQQMRAGLVHGCQPLFPYMEVRVPSFEDPRPAADFEFEPETAQEVLYRCTLFYDRHQLTDNEGTAVIGQTAAKSFATMLPDTSIVMGFMVPKENGSLDYLLISNIKGKKQKWQELKLSKKNRVVSMKALDGHKISFTCEKR